MKKIIMFCLLWPAMALHAQTDSLDNIVFKLPNGRIEQERTYMHAYVAIGRTVYELAAYQQQPASGRLTADFRKEWNEIVLAMFNVTVAARPVSRNNGKGISWLSFSAPATNKNNGGSFYVQLNVYDCGAYIQSVIVYTATKKDLLQFDSTYQALIADVKKNTNAVAAGPTNNTQPFSGAWAKSASNFSGFDPGSIITDQGYYKGQYDFAPNGSYVFHGESWGGHMRSAHYLVIDENGTYTINGDQLILAPSKSVLKETNHEGVVRKTQNLSLEKRSYRWQLYYFEGLQEYNLVLSGVKENMIDGGFGSNELFPSSFLYSQKYKPEWKIK